MEDASYVKVLEEYLKSLNLNAVYKLIHDEKKGQGRSICFELTVNDKTITGVGKTKKKAKEAAAELMYNKLIDEEKERAKDKSTEKSQNPIDELTAMCAEFKLGEPTFEYESDVGPSHGTMHSVRCSILGLSEEVRSFRKDRAKKQAAQKLFMKLKEQVKVHDDFFKEKSKDFALVAPDGKVNEVEKEKFIDNVWKQQFTDNLKKSKSALELQKKDPSYINELEDPEILFSRIIREMGITYDIDFHPEGDEWVCCLEIKKLYFKMNTPGKDKKTAGKLAIRRVLDYMHSL